MNFLCVIIRALIEWKSQNGRREWKNENGNLQNGRIEWKQNGNGRNGRLQWMGLLGFRSYPLQCTIAILFQFHSSIIGFPMGLPFY